MSIKNIATDQAPAAVGPYSQGMTAEKMVFTSGQLPIDPKTGKMVEGTIQDKTEQALKNMQAVIEAGGATINDIAKVTVFVKDMNQFGQINEVYTTFFKEHKPARSLVEVARLPLDGEIEIEAVAIKG